MKVWDIIENRACAAFADSMPLKHAADNVFFFAVYTNTFMSKVSRGLDKPNPKLLGQDKTRLEVAVG